MEREELTRRLKDCGIGPRARQEIAACGCDQQRLCLLCRERSGLLDDLHLAQRRIDLMDLLIQSLKQEDPTKQEGKP